MNSLSAAYLGRLRFDAGQTATLRALAEYRDKQELFLRPAPAVLKSLSQVAVIESSVSSNRLEGVSVPPRRLKALIIGHTQPRDRSEQEIAGYYDALSLIHDCARDLPFSTEVVLQLHATLYRYTPNPAARCKSAAMAKLTMGYTRAIDAGTQDPLVLLPLTILDFLCLHPFIDGNGRLARLLALMLLYHSRYEVGRYISIERVYEDTKQRYYDTLAASSRRWQEGEHEAYPWLEYFWAVLLRAYREFEERVGQVGGGRGSKTERVCEAVWSRREPFSISEIEAACAGVSRDMVRLVLRQLKADGVIAPTGKGRSARWIRR
jgi:Fic family protein